VASVNEGGVVMFTLVAQNVSDGTRVPYTISGSGITSNDFDSMQVNGSSISTALTGNFIIQNGVSTLRVVVAADRATEGAETFTVSLDNGQSAVSVTVNDTSNESPKVYGSPGTYTFTVPAYTTSLQVEVWGGGGAGGKVGPNTGGANGTNGGASSAFGITAGGGTGGTGGVAYRTVYPSGAGGTATGGNQVNTSGTTPPNPTSASFTPPGGTAPYGGLGGPGATGVNWRNGLYGVFSGGPGQAPGGGGGGSVSDNGRGWWNYGGAGGSGAYGKSVFAVGALTPGATQTITVGAGGVLADWGATGGNGRVIITWS
jgi:hypothetical protein